jgi:hypothetical protein
MTIYELVEKINASYARLNNWRLVGDEFKINKGVAYRIAKNGYEPHEPHIRATLGLPILMPAPVCPIHNVVHVSKTCPVTKKPRPVWVRVPGHAGGEWQ